MRSIYCLFVLGLVAICPFAQGIEEIADRKAKDPPWLRLCKEGMEKHKMSLASNLDRPLTRLDHPVLIHSQSVRDDQLGAVYLWVDDEKRPAVIGDGVVAPDPERPGTHYFVQEFHSLSAERIVAELSGTTRWRTKGPGISWQPIPDFDDTPTSRKLMAIQSRGLGRNLKAHAIDWRRGDQRREYRFLSKPLYTYKTTNDDNEEVIMGCVFAFCLSVDPEIIFCVESRTKGNSTKWYRAFAGFSDMHIFVELDGKTIWKENPPRFGYDRPHCAIAQVNLLLPNE